MIKSLTNNMSRVYSGVSNEHFKYSLSYASLYLLADLFLNYTWK